MIAHAQSGKIKEVLQSISASWTKLNPDEPFEYSFLDQDFQKNYIAEERLAVHHQVFYHYSNPHFLPWSIWLNRILR
jgi:hypothetical protein